MSTKSGWGLLSSSVELEQSPPEQQPFLGWIKSAIFCSLILVRRQMCQSGKETDVKINMTK
jgi:hypothetical protein